MATKRAPGSAKKIAAAAPRLVLREVTPARWDDMTALFEARGGPKSCWCMIFRADAAESRAQDGAARKRMLEKRVREGVPIGLLGYVDGAPVAWCSVAPRDTFRRLGGVDGPAREIVWSVTCFFVLRSHRGLGYAAQLLAGAVALARKKGADRVEGYPVAPDSPSYRFMGFLPLFRHAGFVKVGTVGTRRTVMQKTIGPAEG